MRQCLLLLLLLLLLPLAAARRAPGDTRPNLIVFFPDTARASDWGVPGYDHPFVRTPHAAALAASGALFEQAHAQHTQCSPSRCALFSGRYMHGRGHRTQNHLLQADEDNLFAALKEANYTTLMLGKNDVLSAAAFNKTFSYWEGENGVAEGGNVFSFGEAGYFSFMSKPSPFNGSDAAHNGDLLAIDRVAAWLAADPPEPFAIWLPGIGAHPPYSAPRDYYSMYSAAQVRALAPLRELLPGSNKPLHLQHDVGIPAFRNLTSFGDAFFEELAAIYLGRVSYVDFVLGRLMAGLDAAGAVGARTALFFSSDHGDFAGDYHAVEKYPCALDDMLTRVPLIARVPGGAAGVRAADARAKRRRSGGGGATRRRARRRGGSACAVTTHIAMRWFSPCSAFSASFLDILAARARTRAAAKAAAASRARAERAVCWWRAREKKRAREAARRTLY